MSEMQSRQVRNDLPDVISLDELPDAPAAPQAAPDVIDINSFPDAISIDSLPDAQPAQPQASGMMEGIGSGLVRGFQNTKAGFDLAEKFNLIEYKNSLEKGGDFETDIGELVMSGKATPAQSDLFRRNVPRTDPVWRTAEIARVTNEMGKLDLAIKDAEATRQNYPGKSMPYQALQQGIEQAKKSTTPFSDFVVSARDNIAGVPELLAEGAYATGRPIVAAIGSGLALRKGQARPIIQTLGPIAASMGVTGYDSYRSTVTDAIEQKAREGGIDLRKNPEILSTLLTDADFIEAVKSDAFKAGVNDAAWAGISTALGMSPKIKGVWQPITQAGAEVLTDLSQKIVRGKEIDTVDLGIAGLTGAAFEAPGYGIGRAIGAFSPSAPAPAAPGAQAQPTPAAPAPATPAAQTQTAPDVIDIDTLPSVAGETAEAPAAPAPVAAVQPELPVQPAAQPQAVAPTPAPAPVAPAQPAPVAEPVAVQPEPVAPVAEAPAPAEQPAQNVEPRPKTPATDAPQAEWDAYWPVSKEWDSKNGNTHWYDGTPKRAEWIKGTPEYEAREARAREIEARRTAERQAQAATPTVEQPVAQPAPAPVAAQPEPTPAPAAEPAATAQPEAKPVAPVAPAAQTEIPGTAETFNLTGEQVAPPATRAEDTTAEMPLPETRENPLATEARARLAKLEAAGKGDSDQAKALRRTIERETQPAAPAAQAEAPAPTAEAPNVDLAQDKNVSAETKAALAKANADVMAAFKKYGKKSQQYKDAQKAKKKIFEKALAEKSKALEAERDAQPNPRTDAEISPPQSPQAEAAPVAEAAPAEQPKAPEPAAEQSKKEAKPAKPRERKPDSKTGEPYEVTLARRRVDNPKTNPSRYTQAVRILDQYENDQKLAKYDPTVDLDKVSDEAMTDFLDAHAQRDDATKLENDYADGVNRAAERRFGPGSEQFGDLLADMRNLAKRGIVLPVLPKWFKRESGRTFADILGSKIPGALKYPPLLQSDPKRAKTDGEFRNDIYLKFEGMVEDYAQSLADLGWTQVEPDKQGSWDAVQELISRAVNGERLVPQGGVQGVAAKAGNPRAYSTETQSADPDIISDLEEEADTREPEPSDEEKQTTLDMEVEYEEPRYDAIPTPAEQAILDAASDNMPTEESILDALDKAAAERLDPKNRSSIGPDLIAAVMWQTARDIQKGVVTFAKWAADTVRNFPSLKGSLKTIWAKAQDIAKRPMDYIRFRALDTIADKVWQNVRRNKGSATLRKIANIVFAKGGPDADAVDNDIPTRVNLVRTQFSNIYASIMERFAADFADMTPEQRRRWDADFRKHVIDGTTPSDPKLAKAVKDFRNLMRDLLAYQRDAGIEMGDQGVNYFPRNYDPDAVEADRPGFVKAAIEMYRRMGERMYAKIMAEPITQEQIDTRAESLKDKDEKAGTTLRSDDEYKRIAEIQLEQTRQERADKYNFSPDDLLQKAEDWATAITHGDVLGLTLFKASEGKITSDATDARKFSNDEAKLADGFLKKNVDDIMLGYIDGAVRGAELARVFGEDGKMFEQMMNKLSKEGVDAETIKETRRLVQKALGVGREQSSQATAVFFDWVNVVLAGAFLGKTAIYNLVLEPISFGVRTGNVYLAVKGMVDTWRYAIAEIGTPSAATRQRIEAKYGSRANFEKAVTETVGEQVGLIQREMERAYFNSHWDYSSGEKGSKLAKWISQRIYRANLMSATEKAKVQASIGIARLALRDNARFLSGTAPIQKLFKALGFDTNADKSAAVIMRENGVPEADHKAFAAFVEGLEGKTDAEWQAAVLDPKNKMAKHYRRALQRMSLGMSIKTNPALKMEMSDSVLGRMLMQLMNYSYAYSNLIKDRMYSMASKTVSKDASNIDRLRYAAPLMVGAPLAVLAAVGSKALIAAMWPSDEMEEINKKKAAARKAFDAASFAGMFGPKIEYLVKGFERGQTPGGPVAETVFRGGQAAFAAASDPESDKKIYNAKKQAYSSTVKPLVTGAGAAVHPFFGFLGNAAVNKQEVREAVIGDKPRK